MDPHAPNSTVSETERVRPAEELLARKAMLKNLRIHLRPRPTPEIRSRSQGTLAEEEDPVAANVSQGSKSTTTVKPSHCSAKEKNVKNAALINQGEVNKPGLKSQNRRTTRRTNLKKKPESPENQERRKNAENQESPESPESKESRESLESQKNKELPGREETVDVEAEDPEAVAVAKCRTLTHPSLKRTSSDRGAPF